MVQPAMDLCSEPMEVLTWDDCQQVIPAAAYATSMLLNQLPHRDAKLLLHSHRVVDMPADAEQLGAGIVLAAEAREPLRAPPQDGGCDCYRLDICDSGGAAPQADICREGGLEPGLSLLAFEALDQGCLLACKQTRK